MTDLDPIDWVYGRTLDQRQSSPIPSACVTCHPAPVVDEGQAAGLSEATNRGEINQARREARAFDDGETERNHNPVFVVTPEQPAPAPVSPA